MRKIATMMTCVLVFSSTLHAQTSPKIHELKATTRTVHEIQVVLHKNKSLKQPRAETPTHFMTMGLSMDLDEATKIATRDMLDWIVDMKGLSREDAYMLASAAMDLVVTQVVDGTKGIHALMPKSIFRKNR